MDHPIPTVDSGREVGVRVTTDIALTTKVLRASSVVFDENREQPSAIPCDTVVFQQLTENIVRLTGLSKAKGDCAVLISPYNTSVCVIRTGVWFTPKYKTIDVNKTTIGVTVDSVTESVCRNDNYNVFRRVGCENFRHYFTS